MNKHYTFQEYLEKFTSIQDSYDYYFELQKEIDRLNNIIEEYKNANEYHQKIIHELETMKQPNQLHSENVKLRAENNRLNNIINEIYEYLDKKKDVPEWWDTDFMICMNILKGGTGNLKDILGSDK